MTTSDQHKPKCKPPRRIVVAMTGASGMPYAERLVQVLVQRQHTVHLVASPAARNVFAQETGRTIETAFASLSGDHLITHPHDDFSASIASGSFLTDGMVICPCSSRTLGAIASGMGDHLIHRAAEVHLKERRRLIVVPRETPVSLIQLENQARLVRAGAVMLPATPAFYHGVTEVAQLIDFIVSRILDQLGVENDLIRRWG